MCDCGCNTCDTKSTLMLNESLAPRDILSEGLKYHMDANKPLTEHLYRAGSDNYFNLWAEARSLYSRNILEITHEDDLDVLTETDLGHYGLLEQTSTVSKRRAGAELKQKLKGVRSDGFGKYDATVYGLDSDGKRVELKSLNDLNKFDKFELAENKKVPLDFPIELTEAELDEMDNMSMNEVTRYSGFNRNPEDPDSEPFQPTGSVAEFKEDLRALFGKFKGDLKNPEFIKGVAQVMVNWKSLLRSQLDEEDIDEMSTSGGAGAYLTPYAFRKKGAKADDEAYTELGYTLAKEGKLGDGADLGPGPKATEDGVKDNAYVKQFKYKLVPKDKKGNYVQKGSGLEVKNV